MQPLFFPLDLAPPGSQVGPKVFTVMQGNAEQPYPTAGVPATLKRELGIH